MADSLPLAGLRIAVTRPQHQADTLMQGIASLGGTAIAFPLLEITPLSDDASLQQALACLPDYDIIIFVSPNAAKFGLLAMHNAGLSFTRQQILAIGNGTAAALRQQGIQDILAPESGADSETLLKLPLLQHIADKHIMIFRAEHGREFLGEALRKLGATVTYAPCYRRSKSRLDFSILKAGRPDILTITSSEALQYLHDMIPPAERASMLRKPLFTLHERISVAARAMGWQNVITAGGGDRGLLEALAGRAPEHEEDHE